MGLFTKKHSVGTTIASLRKEKGWTQVELAEKLQVSDKAVSKWEKDDSFPSIEFFPVLAELFNVSIDYLMTGKAPEKEIVVMSQAELCAKNDDVKLFASMQTEKLQKNDDNDKTILDYMLQYDSKKLVDAFFLRFPAKTILEHNSYRRGYPNWYTEKVLKLLIVNNKIEELNSIHAFVRKMDDFTRGKTGIFADSWRQLIFTHPNVSGDLKLLYLSAMTSNEIDDALSIALDHDNNNDISIIWNMITEINNRSISAKQQREHSVHGRYMTSVQYSEIPRQEHQAIGTSDYYYYFVVKLSTKTIQKLLDKGFLDIARKANDYNRITGGKIVSQEKIQIAELKKNGGNAEQIRVLDLMQDGVVNIDRLLETKDFVFAKKVLENHPVLFIETMIDWFETDNWRALFEYAIDNHVEIKKSGGGNSQFADDILKLGFDKEKLGTFILECWNKGFGFTSVSNPNKKHLYFYEKGEKIDITEYTPYQQKIRHPVKTLNEISSNIAACKKRILDDLAMQLDKASTIGELTKEYFYEQLEKGNTDIVIIKLCVRLESILKNDYRYEGDFAEMLKRYCECKLHWTEDDGWGYMVHASDEKTIDLLQKLRMKRNSIVHSEKTQVSLTTEDIRYCIEYIGKMG